MVTTIALCLIEEQFSIKDNLKKPTSGDWTAVQRNVYIPLDLDYKSLEIKTGTRPGNYDQVKVHFLTTQGDIAGGVEISSFSTPKYYLLRCSYGWSNLPDNLPTEVDKIWRITLTKTAEITLKIHCNSVEVVNVILSDGTCGYRSWRDVWSRDVEGINFVDNSDFDTSYTTAPDYYRARHKGI